MGTAANALPPGGSYGNAVYSGGTHASYNGDAVPVWTDAMPDGPMGNAAMPDGSIGPVTQWGGGSGGSTTANCKGTISAAFPWIQGVATTAAPAPCIVTEISTAQADGTSYPASAVTGSGDNQLGLTGSKFLSLTQTPITFFGYTIGMSGTQTCTTTRVTGHVGPAAAAVPADPSAPPPTLTLTCAPTANADAATWASASVTYSASASPLTIDPGPNAQLDSTGKYDILVGQHCVPVLLGIPPALIATATYKWSVTGTTFQSWSPTTPSVPAVAATDTTPAIPAIAADAYASYYVGGPGKVNIPASGTTVVPGPSGWYWNDQGPDRTSETITCVVTITPPDGEGDPFDISVTQVVWVYLPDLSELSVIAGYVQVNSLRNNSNIELWAGPKHSDIIIHGRDQGMNWAATVNTPSSPVIFGTGKLNYIQTATAPGYTYTTGSGTYPLDTYPEARSGLDTHYPYQFTDADHPENGSTFRTEDNPFTPVNDTIATTTLKANWTMYLMYQPPGSTMWVPLAQSSWNINTKSDIPSLSHHWSNYSATGLPGAPDGVNDWAGNIGFGGFAPNNEFPRWFLWYDFQARTTPLP